MRSEHQMLAMGLKPNEPFAEFPKIHRYNRRVVATEKLDGTNALVRVSDDGERVFAGSRTRWISVEDDNQGFARWVQDNRDELAKLGPGHHYGEWWGRGIGRNYGLRERRFSLFNVSRWRDSRPTCCHVVPVLWEGLQTDFDAWGVLIRLQDSGSVAAPGFMRPEGIVVFHEPSNHLYKMTLDANDRNKGAVP